MNADLTADPVPVDDITDERVAQFRIRDRQLLFQGRQGRRDEIPEGLFAAEGDLVVARALAAGFRPRASLIDHSVDPALARQLGESGPVFVASASLRSELTGLGVPAAVITLFHRRPPLDANEMLTAARRVVVVEEVDNPTNLGTIIRSAVGLGWDAIAVDATSADPFARRSVRTSMGTVFRVASARLLGPALEALERHGFESVALTPRADAVDIRELAAQTSTCERLALILGAERSGLSEHTIRHATHAARIPMFGGTNSLNVAAAAAVACYALSGTPDESALAR